MHKCNVSLFVFVIKMCDGVRNITRKCSTHARCNNIPYGNNHWLILIYINKQFYNSKKIYVQFNNSK